MSSSVSFATLRTEHTHTHTHTHMKTHTARTQHTEHTRAHTWWVKDTIFQWQLLLENISGTVEPEHKIVTMRAKLPVQNKTQK